MATYHWHAVKPEDQARIECGYEGCSAGATRCQHVDSAGALSFHYFCTEHAALVKAKEDLFIAIFPGGIGYCDTSKEEHGDYKKIAFLGYRSLELEIHAPKSKLLPEIRAHAARIQAKRGQQFVVSGCGQTVTLGA